MDDPPQNPFESPREQSGYSPDDDSNNDARSKLVEAVSFAHISEAQLFQSLLRQHGIRAQIANEATLGVNVLWSNAIGGVKVLVMAEDLQRVADLLAEGDAVKEASGESAAITFDCEECNAQITFPGERRGYVETCPQCYKYIDVPE